MVSNMFDWLRADSGAVTVDWTILAAAIVGLGVATVGAVRTGAINLGTDVSDSLTSASVVSLGELGSDAGSGWQFTPLYTYSPDWFYGPGGLIAQIASWNWSDAQLQAQYDQYAVMAQNYIDNGNASIAGLMVDHMYSVQMVLANQGATPLPTSITVQSLHQVVSQM